MLARTPGSIHPGPVVEVVSDPDWRGREVTLRVARVLSSGERILLVDDWIETGSQARATRSAVEACGVRLVGVSVIVDEASDDGRADLDVESLVRSWELPPAE